MLVRDRFALISGSFAALLEQFYSIEQSGESKSAWRRETAETAERINA